MKQKNKNLRFLLALLILIAVAVLWNRMTPKEYAYGSLIPVETEAE